MAWRPTPITLQNSFISPSFIVLMSPLVAENARNYRSYPHRPQVRIRAVGVVINEAHETEHIGGENGDRPMCDPIHTQATFPIRHRLG